MGYYIRMIGYGKWSSAYEEKNKVPEKVTNADVITSELRTKENTLSLWKIDDVTDLEKINEICLSLALERDSLTRLDIMIIEEEWLNKHITTAEIKHTPEGAKSFINNLDEKHYDLTNMTYDSLGEISECMFEIWKETIIDKGECYVLQKSVSEIKKIYNNLDKNKIDVEELKNKKKIYLEISGMWKTIQSELSQMNCFKSDNLKLKRFKLMLHGDYSIDSILYDLKNGLISFGTDEENKKISSYLTHQLT